ncbi:MAG: ATPase, T2SS/T4P/T4SS family [Myxococcota bacterium]
MSRSLDVSVAKDGDSSCEMKLPIGESIVLGRDPSCDIVLASPEVSREHVELFHVPAGVQVVDRSVNGTWFGSQCIRDSALLVGSPADLTVASYRIRLRIVEAVSARVRQPNVPPEIRRDVHRRLLDHLDLASLDRSQMTDEIMRPKVVAALEKVVDRVADDLSTSERATLVNDTVDEVLGLGPLQKLLDDDEVSEIMVVDPDSIYVERSGRLQLTSLRFTDGESCRAAIERIVSPLGRRIDESAPLVDARLPDGSRVNAVIPPLAVRGPCITIRKFPQQALGMSELVTMGSLTRRMAVFLQRCVVAKKNILISGGTGSGKTTLLNALSRFIPEGERIVTIEDAAELQLQQPHVVSLEAKPPNLEGAGSYSIRDLVKNALRMRPDRIVVGECRADEAIDMLQAMNTGHAGSMTTTHANSALEALSRIQTLCMMAGLDLPRSAICEQVGSSIDVVVQQTRFPDGTRRITTISEVEPPNRTADLSVRDIFTFTRTGIDTAGATLGDHRATGYLPTFLGEFALRGSVEQGSYLP